MDNPTVTEDDIRILRGKLRIESECEHEGKMNIDGCEFCGALVVTIPLELYKRMMKLEEFKTIDWNEE